MRQILRIMSLFAIVLIGSSQANGAEPPEDIDTLIKNLSGDDRELQDHALSRLLFADEAALSAVPALVKVIEGSDDEHRIGALHVLANLGPLAKDVTQPIGEALKDPNAAVRIEAASALLRILGESDAAIAALGDALLGADPENRAAAASEIWYLGPLAKGVAPALAKAAIDDDPAVRAEVAQALGEIGPVPSDQSMTPLRTLLADDSPLVQVRAARSLWQLDEPAQNLLPTLTTAQAKSAIGAIAPLLDDPIEGLSAAQAMARLDPNYPGQLERLQAALVDSPDDILLPAARALGNLGPNAQAALPALLAQLDRHDKPFPKTVLAAAIVKIDRRQEKAIVEFAKGIRACQDPFEILSDDETGAWSSLGSDGAPAIEELISGLKYEDPDRRQDLFWAPRREAQYRLRSAELLIDISARLPEVIDALIELCRSADCTHRGKAADALGRIGPPAQAAAPVLTRLLADQEAYVVGGDFYGNGGTRLEPGNRAALALVRIGAPAVPALRASLRDIQPLARRHAAEALGSIGREPLPAVADLVAALKDPIHSVRAAAAEALGKIGDTDDLTTGALVQAIKDTHLAVRAAAANALGNLGPVAKPATAALSKLLDDPFELARNAAAEALHKIRAD